MGFSRQEHCSGLPCPPPGDLPDPGIEPGSPTLLADSLLLEPLRILPQLISRFTGRFFGYKLTNGSNIYMEMQKNFEKGEQS